MTSGASDQHDALSLWVDGPNRRAIEQFVARVTDPGSADYVEPVDRIAVFDNDGTLWVEQPMYTQLRFALDHIPAAIADRPELVDHDLVEAARTGDLDPESVEHAVADLLMQVFAGTTTDEFRDTVGAWMAQARHPHFDRPYSALAFAPQLQLLAYLRQHDFRTFIISGGGVEFMRSFAEEVYGMPPEQVVGSNTVTTYEVRDGKGMLVLQSAVHFVDDGPGKPVGVNAFVGRRPIIAVGNSDGDFELLEYTTTGEGARLGIYIHHDDADREFAYDRDSIFGGLDRGLDEAEARGWLVVSMRTDWAEIFAEPPA
jgi:hypothetical protein